MNDVLIVGGGIAGLCAALALLRQGQNVRVFEQEEACGETGGGVSLSRPASRGLFSLGLMKAIELAADVPDLGETIDFMTGERRQDSGLVIRKSDDADPVPFLYQMHRADLRAILADRIAALDPQALVFGRKLTALVQNDEGVIASFEDGSTVRGKIAIGADGRNSLVRELMFGTNERRFTGYAAYRFLVPARAIADDPDRGQSIRYAGPDRLLLRYPIRKGTLVNGIAFVPAQDSMERGWSALVSGNELMAQFPDATPEMTALLQQAHEHGARKRPLFDRDPLPHWTVGRVALLGDAAHPILPFLGLGTATSIEDAVVLGRAFASTRDPCDALHIYEATRKPRANAVLLASRGGGDFDLGGAPGDGRRAEVDELMSYDPSTVALAG
jgi:salicylate hydroxylase